MMPSVQHLHGEPVALGDPSDQDVVRSRLCRTQWPSRKVGRVWWVGGSIAKARFLRLSQQPAPIGDVAHKPTWFRKHPACADEPSQKIGTIVQKALFAPRLSASDLTKPWFTK